MNKTIHIHHQEKIIECTALLVPHRKHLMYKVIFENGYENIFYTDVETGKWIEEDLGFTRLAEMFGGQIRLQHFIPIHVPKILTWHRQVTCNKPFLFGFFNFKKGHHKMYEIYDSRTKYMYTLVEMDEADWQIMGNSNVMNGNVDRAFINQVTKILPLYSANF